MKNILVTGAGGPAGVNFCKSLKISREDFRIIGTDVNDYHMHLMEADVKYKTPRADDDSYLEVLNKIIKKEEVDLVHPQPDIEVFYVGSYRDSINAKVFLPKQETIALCQDKELTSLMLRIKDKPAPKTLPLLKHDKKGEIMNNLKTETINEFFEHLGSPMWVRATKGAGGRGSTIAHTPETVLNWCNYWRSRDKKWDFIAQEYLSGRNIAFHSVWKKGELISSMARERLEYIYPYLSPSGITGTPVVQRTVHDSKINNIGPEVIKTLDPEYDGVACVDFKENRRGDPFVTEINPGRFFTTSFFFTRAGLNLPYIYVKTALEESIKGYIPLYNGLPKDFYWIRHIDCRAKLLRDGTKVGEM